MYRHLVMFPKSADESLVDELVGRMAEMFKQGAGFHSITTSVDALMGPSAQAGQFGRVVEADFDTLDHALAVLDAEGFQDVEQAAQALEPTIFVYELADL